jgi:hypothetical protein
VVVGVNRLFDKGFADLNVVENNVIVVLFQLCFFSVSTLTATRYVTIATLIYVKRVVDATCFQMDVDFSLILDNFLHLQVVRITGSLSAAHTFAFSSGYPVPIKQSENCKISIALIAQH